MNIRILSVILILMFCPFFLLGQRRKHYIDETYIDFNIRRICLKPGQHDTIAIIAKSSDAIMPVKWYSLDPKVATVDAKGRVTGRHYGLTSIIASTADNMATDTCMVIVAKSRTYTANRVSFDMIFVQGGTFWMGNNNDERTSPEHKVTLSDYYIGETEVTQALWEAVLGFKPTLCGQRWSEKLGFSPDHPVYYVSWDDCQAFIDKLNLMLEKQLKGYVFAFPTEAQWEFAARGGNYATIRNGKYCYAYAGSSNIVDVGWYGEGFEKGTSHPVKLKLPNELGIYDMTGNVQEWCEDRVFATYESYPSNHVVDPYYDDGSEYHVVRGCEFINGCCCAVYVRDYQRVTNRFWGTGLRLALYKKNQQWVKKIGQRNIKPPLRVII